jgi:hypothetical protein
VAQDADAFMECEWRCLGRDKPTDAEMLTTYATGLLAMALCRYFFSLFNSLLEEIVIVYRHYYYSDDDSHLILATLPPPLPLSAVGRW